MTNLGECHVEMCQGGGTPQEHHECLRELAATTEELRRSQEHLALFAGQVSHDLRTPLTAILAQAEMLASEPTVKGDEDVLWMVEAIARASRRLNTMIDQMLEYAREGGEASLGITDLDAVAESVVRDLGPSIAEAGAEITRDALPTVAADARQMHAVLLNLLSNAIVFARPDVPPRVHVGAERVGERWKISVSDNGIGVAPERREAMFALFARADKRIDGAGIGLAVAKRVVETHGGRIGMTDAPGGGTTVWFELLA